MAHGACPSRCQSNKNVAVQQKSPFPKGKDAPNSALPNAVPARYDQFLVAWDIAPYTIAAAGFLADGSAHRAAFPTESQWHEWLRIPQSQ